jgi:hypothetical protein
MEAGLECLVRHIAGAELLLARAMRSAIAHARELAPRIEAFVRRFIAT